ncbi:uncharacterized protein TEOVI_000660200 [Trypanosoma equiperdum]|uniref:Uncharacterized protein n=1 Tax=Trypanosoma equiperdum TaxID=5694 RepID=A0A1G4I6I8_TRYEQ|nr:hypothetical protein, conserved [Trypanosoma equiperdum]
MRDEQKEYATISGVWTRLILFSTLATAVIYVAVGLFACRRLIRTNWQWILIAVVYFAVGLIHAFFSLSLLCLAIGCVFWVFGAEPMSLLEILTYTTIMVVHMCFFAMGKKTILHVL